MRNKISEKTIITLIIVLLVLSIINIVGILTIDKIMSEPASSYTVSVLGAVFKEESKPNVIDVDIILPPREAVFPGDTSTPMPTITNTVDFDTYLRATYKIEVKNGDGKLVDDFFTKVDVKLNENWQYQDGYWYYSSVINPGESVPGPIESITYSEEFNNYLDYKVYIPVLIESVEADGKSIEEVDYWPNKNINKIDTKDWIDYNSKYSQTIVIEG